MIGKCFMTNGIFKGYIKMPAPRGAGSLYKIGMEESKFSLDRRA